MRVRGSILFPPAAVLCAGIAAAQPSLDVTRIDVQWPRVTVGAIVQCGGQPTAGLEKLDFLIRENGVAVRNFVLACPDTFSRCPISVALVFDASGSMAGTPIRLAQDAGLAFIGMMDGATDEGCVVAFHTSVTMLQPMTVDLPFLSNAVRSLAAGGSTAMWSGAMRGLRDVAAAGRNPCRAVIVLGDGHDNASTVSLAQLVDSARAFGIPIYTVGLGNSVDTLGLQTLAEATGGAFFRAPSAEELPALYAAIARVLHREYECTLAYDGSCIDDSVRTVTIRVAACGGAAEGSRGYRAPDNAGVRVPARIVTGSIDVPSGAGADLAFDLEAPGPLLLPPMDAELCFDDARLALDSIAIPPGSVLGPAAVTTSAVPGGARFRVAGTRIAGGSGPLVVAHFRAPVVDDTVTLPVALTRWSFDDGCVDAALDSAVIRVVPCGTPPRVTADGPTALCEGDTVTLVAATVYHDYAWFRDGVPFSSGRHLVRVSEAGTYTVVASDSTGCARRSAAFEVTVAPRRSYTISLRAPYVPAKAGAFDVAVETNATGPAGAAAVLGFALAFDTTLCIPVRVQAADPAWLDSASLTELPGGAAIRLIGTPPLGGGTASVQFRVRRHPLFSRVASLTANDATVDGACAAVTVGRAASVLFEGTCGKFLAGSGLALHAYPNPFHGETELLLRTVADGPVTVFVSDRLGRVVRTVALDAAPAGERRIPLDASGLPAGTYCVIARAGEGWGECVVVRY